MHEPPGISSRFIKSFLTTLVDIFSRFVPKGHRWPGYAYFLMYIDRGKDSRMTNPPLSSSQTWYSKWSLVAIQSIWLIDNRGYMAISIYRRSCCNLELSILIIKVVKGMEKRFLFLSDRPLITNSRFIGREFSPRGLMRDFLRSISTFLFFVSLRFKGSLNIVINESNLRRLICIRSSLSRVASWKNSIMMLRFKRIVSILPKCLNYLFILFFIRKQI